MTGNASGIIGWNLGAFREGDQEFWYQSSENPNIKTRQNISKISFRTPVTENALIFYSAK